MNRTSARVGFLRARERRTLVLTPDRRASRTAEAAAHLEGLAVDVALTLAAARELAEREPDRYVAAVLELDMPDGSGQEISQLLLGERHACCSLITSEELPPSSVVSLRQLGLARTLPRTATTNEFRAALRDTAVETLSYRAKLRRRNGEGSDVCVEAAMGAGDRLMVEWLSIVCGATEKEVAVAGFVRVGAANEAIAAALGVSLAAVRQRLQRLQSRCFVASKPELARLLSTLFPSTREAGGERVEPRRAARG